MMLFTEFQWIEAIGWTLLHALWQGLVIAILLRVILLMVPARAAAVRYALSLSAICLMLLWAAVTCWNHWPAEALPVSAEVTPPVKDTFSDLLPVLSDQEGASAVTAELSRESISNLLQPYLPYFVILWMIGVLGWSLRLLGSMMYIYRLPRRHVKQPSQHWQRKLAQLQAQLNVAQPERLLISTQVQEPLTMGMLKPVILIPAALLTHLPPAQIEAILLHELAHIRRADYFVNLLLAIVEILFFYHPAYWWIAKQIKQEREHCCDDQVVKRSGDQYTYAQALIAVQRLSLTHKNHLAMNFSGEKSQFSYRIQRLFGQSATSKWHASIGSLVIVSLLVLGFLLGPISQNAQAQQEQALALEMESLQQDPPYTLSVEEDMIAFVYNLLDATEADLAELQAKLKGYQIDLLLRPFEKEAGWDELIVDYRGKKRQFVFRNAGTLTMHFFPKMEKDEKSVHLSLGAIPAERKTPEQGAVEFKIIEFLVEGQLAKQKLVVGGRLDSSRVDESSKQQVVKVESVPRQQEEPTEEEAEKIENTPTKVENIPTGAAESHKITLEFDSINWVHLNDAGEERDDWYIMGPKMDIEVKDGSKPFWVLVIEDDQEVFLPLVTFEALSENPQFKKDIEKMTLLTAKAAAKRFDWSEDKKAPVLIVKIKPGVEKYVVVAEDKEPEDVNLIEDILFYPNPSDGQMKLRVKTMASGIMDVYVLDISGKEMRAPISHKIEGSEALLDLGLQHLPAGSYMIKVVLGDDVETRKIMIQ